MPVNSSHHTGYGFKWLEYLNKILFQKIFFPDYMCEMYQINQSMLYNVCHCYCVIDTE